MQHPAETSSPSRITLNRVFPPENGACRVKATQNPTQLEVRRRSQGAAPGAGVHAENMLLPGEIDCRHSMQKDLKLAGTSVAVARPALLGKSVTVRDFFRSGTYGR